MPLRQSEHYVRAAVAAGDPARLVVLPGVGHMELVEPGDPAWEICRDEILKIL